MISHQKLKISFYQQPTFEIAKNLLGKFLIHRSCGIKNIGKIVETEVYYGLDDLASHASKGKTKRTKIMFGPPSRAYIYLVYGIYHCFNIVTEKTNFPAAILIRALEPISPTIANYSENIHKIDSKPASGPGKLCNYLKINKSLNGVSLLGNVLYIEDRGVEILENNIVATKRIGINYAKHCINYNWRFYIKNNNFVSKI
jgi:DNA-3-methyladenine glycosylase